jgi:hypothetical protein
METNNPALQGTPSPTHETSAADTAAIFANLFAERIGFNGPADDADAGATPAGEPAHWNDLSPEARSFAETVLAKAKANKDAAIKQEDPADTTTVKAEDVTPAEEVKDDAKPEEAAPAADTVPLAKHEEWVTKAKNAEVELRALRAAVESGSDEASKEVKKLQTNVRALQRQLAAVEMREQHTTRSFVAHQALAESGARNPSTALKLIDLESDGVDTDNIVAQVNHLRETEPYLFGAMPSAIGQLGGAGQGAASPPESKTTGKGSIAAEWAETIRAQM